MLHLDCAWWYKNQQYTAKAMLDSGIPREKIYITTKSGDFYGNPEAFDAEQFLETSLRDVSDYRGS